MYEILDQNELFNTILYKERFGIPVLLYGMGDGADKIINWCNNLGITISEVFTSNDFYREKIFRGFPLRSMDYVKAHYDDAIVLVAFGTNEPQIIMQICDLEDYFTVLVPDMALFGEHTPILSFGEDLIYEVADLFEEDSRELYFNLINYKITGSLDYLLPCHSIRDRIYSQIDFGLKNEIYVDCGAYDGDTIEEARKYLQTHRYRNTSLSVIAFEPDPKNMRKLNTYANQYIKTLDKDCIIPDITLYPYAVSDKDSDLSFDNKAGRQSHLSEQSDFIVKAVALDNIIDDCTVIKFDVEGAESKALLGARKLIATKKPRLIVSCYHRSGDILTLPKLIKELNPEYKLCLHQTPYIPSWDTDIIAY